MDEFLNLDDEHKEETTAEAEEEVVIEVGEGAATEVAVDATRGPKGSRGSAGRRTSKQLRSTNVSLSDGCPKKPQST